jgi:hypothetical protein
MDVSQRSACAMLSSTVPDWRDSWDGGGDGDFNAMCACVDYPAPTATLGEVTYTSWTYADEEAEAAPEELCQYAEQPEIAGCP